ncbi:MAG: MOSC domain-containing protein [Bacteroidota bacterium]
MAYTMKELLQIMPQIGSVDWISRRPAKRGIVESLKQIEVSEEDGLKGDHYGKKGGKRMVTLIQAEHIKTVENILKKESIDPKLLRRNIVVSGINLLALKDQVFQIGEVQLKMTGLCHPCSRMETNLGAGGYNAMRGHGGITAKVVKGGMIRLGDEVKLLLQEIS